MQSSFQKCGLYPYCANLICDNVYEFAKITIADWTNRNKHMVLLKRLSLKNGEIILMRLASTLKMTEKIKDGLVICRRRTCILTNPNFILYANNIKLLEAEMKKAVAHFVLFK